MPSLMAIMEVPAILVALFFAKTQSEETEKEGWGKIIHELLAGKGTILLVGGMLIGLISGQKGFDSYSPLFDAPFRGVLVLFLLEVGLVTGRRLEDLKKLGPFLLFFAIALPLFNAGIGIYLAKWAQCRGSFGFWYFVCQCFLYRSAYSSQTRHSHCEPFPLSLSIPGSDLSFQCKHRIAFVFDIC